MRLLDPRTGEFAWDPINIEQLKTPIGGMNGRLAGFLIQFYKTSGNLNARSELKTHKVDGDATTTIINNLPSYAVVNLQISVLNDRYQGEFSPPVLK